MGISFLLVCLWVWDWSIMFLLILTRGLRGTLQGSLQKLSYIPHPHLDYSSSGLKSNASSVWLVKQSLEKSANYLLSSHKGISPIYQKATTELTTWTWSEYQHSVTHKRKKKLFWSGETILPKWIALNQEHLFFPLLPAAYTSFNPNLSK